MKKYEKMARYGKIWEDHPFLESPLVLFKCSTQKAWFLGDLHTIVGAFEMGLFNELGWDEHLLGMDHPFGTP